jgi:hypothetical protein
MTSTEAFTSSKSGPLLVGYLNLTYFSSISLQPVSDHWSTRAVALLSLPIVYSRPTPTLLRITRSLSCDNDWRRFAHLNVRTYSNKQVFKLLVL